MTSDPAKLAELAEWMRGKEGEGCEFKEAKARFDFQLLGKYCCALANERGGLVILGVTDKRPRRVVGNTAFDQPERTRKGLCDGLHLNIDCEEIAHPDGRVLVFRVPSRPLGVPLKWDGRYWMRRQDELPELDEERLRAILNEAGRDFTAEGCPGLGLADLDPAAVEGFRRRWVAKVRRAGDERLAA